MRLEGIEYLEILRRGFYLVWGCIGWRKGVMEDFWRRWIGFWLYYWKMGGYVEEVCVFGGNSMSLLGVRWGWV